MPSIQLSERDLAALSPAVRAEFERLRREAKGKGRKKKTTQLLPSYTTVTASGVVIVQVGVETKNESNGRQWRQRSHRSGVAWRAVREAVDLALLAPIAAHAREGGVVKVKFTRVGGCRLDVLTNLPSALKAVEDVTAFLVGLDDGCPRWLPSCDQLPGGDLVGVRIEIEGVG